jgi:hypothetical protein
VNILRACGVDNITSVNVLEDRKCVRASGVFELADDPTVFM